MTKRQEDYTIITAAGKGIRMGSSEPKQFLLLKNKPILMRTIELFYDFNNSMNLILTLSLHGKNFWQELCLKHKFNIPHTIVIGGETRFQSIKNALKKIRGNGITLIHDGVRPLVSSETIKSCFNTAKLSGNAVASNEINFSLRKVTTIGNKSVNREKYKEIQTPQAFRTDLIKKAYEQKYVPEFTDDASVVESLGVKINLIRGNFENIKITTPFDLKLAESLLN